MFQRFLLTTAAAVALISGPALAAQDAIRLGMVLEPPGLDPTANAAAAIDEVVYANLFEGLTRFAPDGSIAPALFGFMVVAGQLLLGFGLAFGLMTRICAFLMALKVRGEAPDEIVGAVEAMRARMLPVPGVAGAVDVVGTGGDHSGSYNVSTLAAIITAACGVPVAKHGNRASSSSTGTADVLEALGVDLSADVDELQQHATHAPMTFLFAQVFHPSMRFAAATSRPRPSSRPLRAVPCSRCSGSTARSRRARA